MNDCGKLKVFGKLIASFITNVIVMEFYYLYYSIIIIFVIIVIILSSFSVGARLTVMMTLLLQWTQTMELSGKMSHLSMTT